MGSCMIKTGTGYTRLKETASGAGPFDRGRLAAAPKHVGIEATEKAGALEAARDTRLNPTPKGAFDVEESLSGIHAGRRVRATDTMASTWLP